MALEAAGKKYGELADGDVPDVQRERVECVDSDQNNGIQRERGGDLLIVNQASTASSAFSASIIRAPWK